MNDQDKQLMDEIRALLHDFLRANEQTIQQSVDNSLTKKLPELVINNQTNMQQYVDAALETKLTELSDKNTRSEQSLKRRIMSELPEELQKILRNNIGTSPMNQSQYSTMLKTLEDEFIKMKDEIGRLRQEVDDLKKSQLNSVISTTFESTLSGGTHANKVQLDIEPISTTQTESQTTKDDIYQSAHPQTEMQNADAQKVYRGVLGNIQQKLNGTTMDTTKTQQLLSNYKNNFTNLETETTQHEHIWLVLVLYFLKQHMKVNRVKFDDISQFNQTLNDFGIGYAVTSHYLNEFSDWLKDLKDSHKPRLRNASTNGGVFSVDKYDEYFNHILTIISGLNQPSPTKIASGKKGGKR
jgi:hypothetical protein